MTRDQFEERLRLSIEKHQGRMLTPDLMREIESDLVAELCDIRDDITAGAVRLQ